VLATPVAALSLCRAVPWHWPTPVVQLLAFTPWLVVPAGLSLLFAAFGRRPWAVAVTGSLLAVQGFWLVAPGHAVPAPDSGQAMLDLKTMSINAKLGEADAAEIVRLVRDNRIALLAVQESTPALEARLGAAGLPELLPHRISVPAPGASGNALYSAHPMAATGNNVGTRFPTATARLRIEAAGRTALIDVTNVHTLAPVYRGLPQWRRDLTALERAAAGPGNVLLLGDFNASYDHSEFRRLLVSRPDGRGLVDVGTAQGARLVPTWPMQDVVLPGITIDHLVTSPSVRNGAYSVHRVAGSDHAAIMATLSVPVQPYPVQP
jgi:endonuclease/exonuclease/phosphatase (EEP) superfamily protein YafD